MDMRRLAGIVLIAIGVLAILNNLDILVLQKPFVLALLLLLIAGGCYYFYQTKKRSLWLLAVAIYFACWGIGKLIDAFWLLPFSVEDNSRLLGISLAFFTVYMRDFKHWWAVIPGGILFVIFVVETLQEFFWLRKGVTSFLILLGFGLVFTYLYLIRDPKNHLHWAIVPAVVLFLFSFFVLSNTIFQIDSEFCLAVVFIGVGTTLILRASFSRRTERRLLQQNLSDVEIAHEPPPPESEEKLQPPLDGDDIPPANPI